MAPVARLATTTDVTVVPIAAFVHAAAVMPFYFSEDSFPECCSVTLMMNELVNKPSAVDAVTSIIYSPAELKEPS